MALDLSYFFAQYGKKFVRELTDKVRRRIGVDGVAYPPIKESTARGQKFIKQVKHVKASKAMGIKQTTFTFKEVARPLDSRLNATLQFRENAFVSDSSDTGVTVAVNDATYPGGAVSYEDIVSYNDRNSDRVNPHIRDGEDGHEPPAIFPMGPDAQALVEGLDTWTGGGDGGKSFEDDLRDVIAIQLADSVKDLHITTKIVIGGQ